MRPLPLILLAVTVLAAPGRALARAAAPEPAALELPALLHAGERVEVRWNGLSAKVREVELELSLDGGRWVRVSPELEAAEGHFTWRVPEVASARTRLRLRAGGESFEGVVAVSADGRIAAPAGVGPGSRGGEEWWRLGEHAGTCDPRLDSPATSLANGGSASGTAPVPESDASLSPAQRVSAPHEQPASARALPAPAADRSPTRRDPMRS